MEAILVYLGLALAISLITISDDRKAKKIKEGYNPNAVDRDGDGIIQEGTKFERKAKKPKKKAQSCFRLLGTLANLPTKPSGASSKPTFSSKQPLIARGTIKVKISLASHV